MAAIGSYSSFCVIIVICVFYYSDIMLFMAALCGRWRHYILQLWFLSLFLLFFLAYSQRSEIGCLPYFHT